MTRVAAAFPARLHALLARDAPVGVVIRRGPARRVALIGWERDGDRFRVGQWLAGRIYERRCDLSPDGRHLIYFAMNGRWSGRARGAWTAISRAPYLKALALWAKGDCWQGGGLFLSDGTYWLNGGCLHELLQDDSRLEATMDCPWPEHYGGECPGVYYHRLQRDGWAMQYTAPDGEGGQVTRFDKRLNDHWRLRKLACATLHRAPGRGVYFDRHQLWNGRTGQTIDLPAWEWAELDRDRVVWAEAGCLFAARVKRAGMGPARRLADFNDLAFERLAAPY
jgi:hypothetical protein